MTADQGAQLVTIARSAVCARIGEVAAAPIAISEALKQRAGLFVTVYVDGELRGCIGQIDPDLPICEAAAELAIAAATHDPRFAPVSKNELPRLSVSVSVLSPPRLGKPEDIRIGQHGLVVSRGARRGRLLPQVAVGHAMDAHTFLEETCRKAGLPRDAWRDPATRLELFTADIFQGL